MSEHQTPLVVSDPEQAVRDRYAAAAARPEAALCCPTGYDTELLRLLPEEIIAKDYGCGDAPEPRSTTVSPGRTNLDGRDSCC